MKRRCIQVEQPSSGSRVSLCFPYFAAAHQPFVSDFTQRYLSTPDSDGHNLLTTTLGTNMETPRTDPTPLLKEWAKATLASRSWRDALVTAVNVSITYRRLLLVA